MRIVHFSDFHLSKDGVENSRALLDRMLKALKDVNKESKIDLVVFSGDLVNLGGAGTSIDEVFQLFKTLVIDRFTSELSVPPHRFIFVPGNHDMYRGNDTEDEDNSLDAELKDIPSIENITRSDRTAGLKRTIPFKEFEKTFYEAMQKGEDGFEYSHTLFQSNVKMIIGGQKIGLTMLNSSWRCWDSEKDKRRIVMGRSQILDSGDFLSDCDVKFAVSHYDISWMKEVEQADLSRQISHQYDAFFSGHTHSSHTWAVIEPEGGVFYIVAPGTLCANVDKAGTSYANAFLVVDYDHSYKHIHAVKYMQDDYEDFVQDKRFGSGGAFDRSISEFSNFVPIATEFEQMFRNEPFIDCPRLQEIKSELTDDNNLTLQLIALSGLGKTRIVVEAFRGKNLPNAYYCQYRDSSDESIFKEIEKILAKHANDNGLIIIDDCPNDVLSSIASKRDNKGSKFRIIGINNLYFDKEGIRGCKLIDYSPDDLKSQVEDYIERNIPVYNNDDHLVRQIKTISGGFPSVAVELIKTFQQGGHIGVETIETLIPKLLQLDKLPLEKQSMYMTALCTLALLQPMPYGRDNAREYILMEDNITPMWGKGYPERRSIFANTISRYKDTFIEISGSWLNVRPQPLAVWLVKQWFKSCDNDPDRIDNLFKSLEAVTNPPQKMILENMAKRMEYMQGNVQAEVLFDELVRINGGPFGNEKVVCSEMGSRLFLSMSTVNPSSVAKCLRGIFSQKPVMWIRDNVTGDTRRNLMWALEKLCFAHESFGDAVHVMALFALAENENYGNNATGQLKQLFHVMLAGTQAPLEERLGIIRMFKNKGEVYKELTLDILQAALLNDHFMRDGGAETFGFEKREEYKPTDKEIIDYWYACRDILIEWAREDASIVEKLSQIINNYYFRWCTNGFAPYIFFPLLESLYAIHPTGNDKLYYDLVHTERHIRRHLTEDQYEQFSQWKQLLMPNSFVTKLRSERPEADIDYKLPLEERIHILEKQYTPLVDEFLSNRLYSSKKEITDIIEDAEYFDTNFSYFLIQKSSPEQLDILFDNLVQIAIERNINVKRGFFTNLFYHARGKDVFDSSMSRLLSAGLQEQYVSLLAVTETDRLTVLARLKEEKANGKINIDYVPIYLKHVSLLNEQMFVDLLKAFETEYDERANVFMAFVLDHRFGMDKDKTQCVIPYVKQLILKYDINSADQNDAFEYSRFVADILETISDTPFVVALNRKIIQEYQREYHHLKLRDIYGPLVKHHATEIWEDFVAAFVDAENPSFYLQIKDELGSGSGFGAGPLFQIGDASIKQMCIDYPDEAPHRIARMIPVFHYDEDQKTDRFSDWFLWLVDNFADKKYVLSELHGNLFTFSWTGTTIPYYERNIKCFQLLLNHRNPEVVEWAHHNIEQCEAEKQMEIDREEYMRLHYD